MSLELAPKAAHGFLLQAHGFRLGLAFIVAMPAIRPRYVRFGSAATRVMRGSAKLSRSRALNR
jgi:hypothetical protein